MTHPRDTEREREGKRKRDAIDAEKTKSFEGVVLKISRFCERILLIINRESRSTPTFS